MLKQIYKFYQMTQNPFLKFQANNLVLHVTAIKKGQFCWRILQDICPLLAQLRLVLDPSLP